jgi:hypothetical protein
MRLEKETDNHDKQYLYSHRADRDHAVLVTCGILGANSPVWNRSCEQHENASSRNQ